MNKYFTLIWIGILLPLIASAQINVRDYGAKGNGKADDTKAIQDAIDKAASVKQYVYFPSGEYIVSHIKVTADLTGTKGATIKKITNKKYEPFHYVMVNKVQNIKIKDLTFDGNGWGANPLEPTQGSIPLYVLGSSNITIDNCKFVNSAMSGLRIENSKNVTVTNSASKNTRGNFGDGFYISKSSNIKVDKCIAEDFTRIGFVTEDRSRDIIISNSTARNGHSASILRGGGEFNGGFWYESSGNVTTTNCVAENITHRGFTAVTGAKVSGVFKNNIAKFDFQNCTAKNIQEGFVLASRSGVAVDLNVFNSSVEKAERGVVLKAITENDVFTIKNVTVSLIAISEKSKNNMAFMWEGMQESRVKKNTRLPQIDLLNCKVNYPGASNLSVLKNTSNNNGDVTSYAGGVAKITINNLSNSLGKAIIKSNKGNPNLQIVNTKYENGYIQTKHFRK